MFWSQLIVVLTVCQEGHVVDLEKWFETRDCCGWWTLRLYRHVLMWSELAEAYTEGHAKQWGSHFCVECRLAFGIHGGSTPWYLIPPGRYWNLWIISEKWQCPVDTSRRLSQGQRGWGGLSGLQNTTGCEWKAHIQEVLLGLPVVGSKPLVGQIHESTDKEAHCIVWILHATYE